MARRESGPLPVLSSAASSRCLSVSGVALAFGDLKEIEKGSGISRKGSERQWKAKEMQ